MSNVVQPREASLAAVRAWRAFLDNVPSIYRPGSGWEDQRFWAIDSAGVLRRIPASALTGFGRRMHIDTLVYAAGVWIKNHQPDAIAMAGEAWVASGDDQTLNRWRAQYGGRTPLLEDPEVRKIAREFGVRVAEMLQVWGECWGQPPVFHAYEIQKKKLGERQDYSGANAHMDSRFAGLLKGDWKPNHDPEWD